MKKLLLLAITLTIGFTASAEAKYEITDGYWMTKVYDHVSDTYTYAVHKHNETFIGIFYGVEVEASNESTVKQLSDGLYTPVCGGWCLGSAEKKVYLFLCKVRNSDKKAIITINGDETKLTHILDVDIQPKNTVVYRDATIQVDTTAVDEDFSQEFNDFFNNALK